MTQTSFIGSAALLASSTVLGQGLVVIVQPFLTRIYKPEDFGWWALYGSILSLAAVVINLRYEQAIQLPKEEPDARGLLLVATGAGLAMSLVIGGAFWFFQDVFSTWLGAQIPGWFAALVGMGLACIALMQSGSMWALRLQRFNALAQTKFQQGLLQAFSQVVLGLIVKGPVGLLMGDVLGRIGGVQALWRLLPRSLEGITFRTMLQTARRYRSFLVFGTGAALLTAASFHLPFILFTAFFGPAAMGQFSLTYRITTIPVTLVAQSIGQVFFARAAAARETPELAQLTVRTATLLMAVGLPIFGALFVVAPQAFPLIFGPNWHEAGVYAQLLAPYLLLSIVAQPLSTLLTVREWQKALLVFTMIELALRMGAIYWGIATQQMYWAVLLFALSSALVAGLSLGLFFRAAGVLWADFWRGLRRFIRPNLYALLLLWGLSHWLVGWSLLGLTVLLSAMLLLFTARVLKKEGLV